MFCDSLARSFSTREEQTRKNLIGIARIRSGKALAFFRSVTSPQFLRRNFRSEKRSPRGDVMSGFPRRDLLAGAAAFAAASALNIVKTEEAAGGDPSFMNNVPDPLLADRELPTFKFELEKSEGKVIGNSYGKEATVEQLPISKGIAGVSMKLEPGAMRELHWHATAAEWAFVIEGRVRTTVIDPQGGSEVNDFDPGDIWYF